jgi:hypothetical protein
MLSAARRLIGAYAIVRCSKMVPRHEGIGAFTEDRRMVLYDPK